MVVETVTFNGVKFRRYPEAKQQAHRRYYRAGIADSQRGIQALHQEVWKHYNGGAAIPDGYHVHHKDHDFNNNSPGNLELVERLAHLRQHFAERKSDPEFRKKASENLRKVSAAAAEWHGSPEGLEWHSKHGKESWEKREYRDLTCEQCGGNFETKSRHGSERFCSNKCKSAWRRDSGVDDVDRECAFCRTEFRVNKYSKARCCGRKCGANLRSRERAGL
ncbi:HNH endonuclease signature motif containing protein [Corynebacterium sp. A21]|uniref:HNH endonuclease signature motif containing protein n=1 Tax=Corynebacterium sp. A21 TaxID=3457318 RepID=UPI003FD36429